MTSPVVLQDLAPHTPADEAEGAWLARLAAHLQDEDHVLHLTGGPRDEEEDDPPLQLRPDGKWWAGRFIGELRFEDRELVIEPRLGIDIVGAWLAHALNLAVIPKAATAGDRGPVIAQLLDRVWSAAVADAARHGGPRLRREVRHESLFVRGRIDVPHTIRHRVAGRPLVATRRAERDLDNPVARVLVLADHALRSLLPVEPDWRPSRTDDVLSHLRAAVGSRPDLPDLSVLRRVRYTPITRRFRPVALLSHEIASRRGRLTSAQSDDASGVLIDVAELWELFLLHCARGAFGRTRVEHGTAEGEGTFLLRSRDHEGRHLGRLKPDILVRAANGRLLAAIDAKYKRLRSWWGSPSGVDRGDLYQLASYLSGHDVPLGVLAYPPHSSDEALAVSHGPWLTREGQEMHFVRVPATENDAHAAMLSLSTTSRVKSVEVLAPESSPAKAASAPACSGGAKPNAP